VQTAAPVDGPPFVPALEHTAPDVVVWSRQEGADHSEPLGVGDFILGPDALAFIARSGVPTTEIKGEEPSVHPLLLGGAIGGAIAAYHMANRRSYPAKPVQTTDAEKLKRIFKRAAKARRAESNAPLARRLEQNSGSWQVPYADIQAIEKQEAGAVRLRLSRQSCFLTSHGDDGGFEAWLTRLADRCQCNVQDNAVVKPAADRIQTICDACGRTIAVLRSRAGQPVKCMYCGTPVTVPAPGDPSPSDAAAADARPPDPVPLITRYLAMMTQGQLDQASAFVADLSPAQRRDAAEALRQIQPDTLSADAQLADVPVPVIRQLMNEMHNELQR
jgi:hypothetical protein